MRLIDREIVQEFLAATDPDTVLVVCAGVCVIKPGTQAISPLEGLIIARRGDLVAMVPKEGITPEDVEHIAQCLDNAARDRCG